MSWRIHEHVVKGEIDNRSRGRVTGRIWLAGVAAPLVLELKGDCEPDLAGCLLTFENPAPVPLTTRPPAAVHRGTAGEITAARKVRVFDVPTAEACMMLKRGESPPEHMANAVYIAWFSKLSGEVVINSADYRLRISEPVWRFTDAEIAERKRRLEDDEEGDDFAREVHADGEDGDWDEFRYEQMLRESDMLGDKYGRLLDKYADHPDQERIVAHEMGWTHLEEALDAKEREKSLGTEGGEDDEVDGDDEDDCDMGDGAEDFEEEPPDPAREGIDWVRDEHERVMHPVAKHAKDAFYALMDELKVDGEDLAHTDDDIGEFFSQFMILHVKLASALGFIARGKRMCDANMIVAWLKRALEIHNETLTAAAALEGHPKFAADRLAHYRSELFRIRESVVAIMDEMRGRRE